jgi:flavin reductase (DIM6/NTAB) family NADH-FMN oxidoreductase RutF
VPEAPFDTRQFRNALGRFASGVTVVTTCFQGQTHGMTANAFTSVSLSPPLVLVSLDNRSNMHRLLPETGRYGISVLNENQIDLSNHFAGRIIEGLHLRFFDRLGLPVLEDAVAWFIVEVIDAHPAGDHTLYIGKVEHFDFRDGRPLLFHAGKYQQIRDEKARPTPWPQDDFSLFSIGQIDPPVT